MVSGLVAPLGGVVALWALWLALLGLALWLLRRRPAWTLVVGPVALLAWLAVVTFGGRYLGWTA